MSSANAKLNTKGFTLIELLIVVAIVGILAAVAIPSFNAYRRRAYNTACYDDLRTFRTLMECYLHDSGHYPVL